MLQINEDHVISLTQNEDVCSQTKDLTEVYTKVEVRKRKLAQGDHDGFKVGDQVLRKNIREEQRRGGKLERDLLGPFVVTNIQGKSADLKSTKGSTVAKINIDHLKRYVEPEVRIHAKWFATSAAQVPSPLRSPTKSCTEPASPEECKCTWMSILI